MMRLRGFFKERGERYDGARKLKISCDISDRG